MIRAAINRYVALLKPGAAGRDALYVFGSRFFTAVVGMVIAIIAARTLGKEGLGVVSVAMSVMAMGGGAADLGVGTATIRFAAPLYKENPSEANAVLAVAFRIMAVAGFAVGIACVLLADQIAGLLGHPELAMLVRIAGIGIALTRVDGFVGAVLQTRRDFRKLAVLGIIRPVIMLAAVAFFAWRAAFTPFMYVVIMVGSSLLVMPFRYLLMGGAKSTIFASVKGRKEYVTRILHFTKWTALSWVAVTVGMRIDTLLLMRLGGKAETGVFHAARQLAFVFPLITGALTTSLLPRAVSCRTRAEAFEYVRKVLRTTPLILILVVPAELLAGWVVPLLFGGEYVPSVLPFRILAAFYCLGMVLGPLSIVLYSFGGEKVLALMNGVQLAVGVVSNVILIPIWGATGAAMSVGIVRLVSFPIVGIALWRLCRWPTGGASQKTIDPENARYREC